MTHPGTLIFFDAAATPQDVIDFTKKAIKDNFLESETMLNGFLLPGDRRFKVTITITVEEIGKDTSND